MAKGPIPRRKSDFTKFKCIRFTCENHPGPTVIEDYVVIIQSKFSKPMISSENNFAVSGTAMT